MAVINQVEKPICTCAQTRIINCRIHGTRHTQGKRTSEGYKPKPNEEVEVRGD